MPEAKQAVIGHFQHSAHIAGFPSVEEKIGFGRIGVLAGDAAQEPKRNQCVEEIARGPRMQPQAPLQGLQIFRISCEFGEEPHLYRAEQRLGSPETEPDLENVFGEFPADVREFD
jgi:hypothetical protein